MPQIRKWVAPQYGKPKIVIASGVKQSPVIPVEKGIQEGRIAMPPTGLRRRSTPCNDRPTLRVTEELRK